MANPEERVWRYLLRNRKATAQEVALNTDVTEVFAEALMNRISSPNWRKEIERHDWGGEPVAPEGGRKDDSGKLRMDLIPPELEAAVAAVLTFGAKKYGDRNWEKGMDWGRAYAALRRHMNAWWAGEENDPETNMPHTWHAACCIAFLIAFQSRDIGRDDRHKLKEVQDAGVAAEESPSSKVA